MVNRKSFELALEDYQNVAEADDKIVEVVLPWFEVDENDEVVQNGTRVYESYTPTEDQVALYAGGLAGGTMARQMAAVTNFLEAVFLPGSHAELIQRIGDRRDPIGLGIMQDVIAYVIEEAAGNPSTGSATSTSSPSPSGTSSKASSRPRAQTRSRGPRAGS